MELNEIVVDPTRGETGTWVENIPGMGDLRLKVRAVNTLAYRRRLDALVAAVPRAKRGAAGIDPAERDRITGMLLLDHVLLDWDGLEEAGAPLVYSRDAAKLLLLDPRYAAFRDAVAWAGEQVAAMRADEVEQAAKN